ncbi:DUF2059 domain-containing protein [Novosphingobium sp. ST904]|uniref:DUF2059 domain-containing protein n=1 Tax=Novosphingobium sp. ST904 TaxID=1684385 RepID=UPI00104BAAC5|nr:DUF2059 domain-containing protein [Novosphingobium sp. ST904]TCM31106.1 uncharacterized protein DUF2059 [Novosphingobium sp. ST904]
MKSAFLTAATAAVIASTAPAWAAEPAAPAAATPVTDPARIAAARQTVDYVFPAGTYARLMNGTLDKMMDSIMDSTMKMPLRQLAGLSGVDPGKLGPASLAEIMEIYDPAFKQRMQISTRTMMSEMIPLMTQVEPDVRAGLTQAYAGKYTAAQLDELNTFFATPTGKAYAADSYLIMMSPEVMEKMQAFAPKLMEQMPSIVEKVKAASAGLPAPRSYAELSKSEKARLAKLLGISETELEKSEKAKAAQ